MTLPVFDLCLKNGSVVLPDATVVTDVYVRDGRIARIGGQGDAGRVIDCTGLTVLPGVIDTQVHFREPGLTGAEDLATGSMAAVMGGVTAVFEMPNTRPATDCPEAVLDKLERARGRMWCDHAFYVGATTDNADRCGELEMLPGTAGIKIFMGSSTGSLLVSDDSMLERVLRSGRRRVAIHAEDETRLQERLSERRADDPSSHPVWRDDETALRATRRIVHLARRTGRRIHVLHVTTPAEMEFLAAHKDIASCEVTPQHLTLAGEEAYAGLGTLAQMNPPIRGRAWRDGLWYWMGQGVPDIIGSDHAPHTLEAKQRAYPASPVRHAGRADASAADARHVAQGR
uniref:dihydroorotase n=1 Tax=Komagataeibacter kakiaceti TaxID=943261 RepID=UPI001F56CE70